jgi:hypothetical protein
VSRQKNWSLAAVALQPGDKVRLPGLRCLDDVNLKTERAQLRSQKLSHLAFLPWGIAGINSNEF